jgi:hypothetical protein
MLTVECGDKIPHIFLHNMELLMTKAPSAQVSLNILPMVYRALENANIR